MKRIHDAMLRAADKAGEYNVDGNGEKKFDVKLDDYGEWLDGSG